MVGITGESRVSDLHVGKIIGLSLGTSDHDNPDTVLGPAASSYAMPGSTSGQVGSADNLADFVLVAPHGAI